MTTREQEARAFDWKLRDAVLITRTLPNGKVQYRISPKPRFEGDVPHAYYSNWCSTEERAWHAAICRRWNRIYSSDFGEGY